MQASVSLVFVMGFLAGVSASYVAGYLGVGRRCGRLLWHLLRHLQCSDRRLWRCSPKAWAADAASSPLAFVQNCENCRYWDATEDAVGTGLASRWHAAMNHVWFTRDGLCEGEEVPDRWCSATSSAAIVLWRAEAGSTVHVIDVLRADAVLDLRWSHHDAESLEAQCQGCCGLPSGAASYCRKWGVYLQEVLLDRSAFSVAFSVRTHTLAEVPTWAMELATTVALQGYRREVAPMQADWIDVWVLVQEFRLRRCLRQLLKPGAALQVALTHPAGNPAGSQEEASLRRRL